MLFLKGERLGQHDSLVLLQELKSGVEGLGRIVRTFESSFKCTREEEDSEGSDLGLFGIRLVCHFVFSIISSSAHDLTRYTTNTKISSLSICLILGNAEYLSCYLRLGKQTSLCRLRRSA